MKRKLKKQIFPTSPYLLFVYLFDKVGTGGTLAPGADLSGKAAVILGRAFRRLLQMPRRASPLWIY
jgi:hypothetical protein